MILLPKGSKETISRSSLGLVTRCPSSYGSSFVTIRVIGELSRVSSL